MSEETKWEFDDNAGKDQKWNSQKTVIVILSVIIVILAVMYALLFAKHGCTPGNAEKEPSSEQGVFAPAQSGGYEDESTGKNDVTVKETDKNTEGDTTASNTEGSTKETGTSKDGEDTSSGETKPPSDETQKQPGQQEPSSSQGSSSQPQNPAPVPPQNPSQQQTVAPVTPPSNQKGTYKAEVTIVNSWEENGKKCYQLSGTVSNTSSVGINTWKIEKELGAGSAIINSWNCNCTVSGGKLVITPADYNGAVDAGGSARDIGLIISSSSTLTAFTYSGTTTNVAVGGSQGGSSNGGGSSNPSPAPSEPVKPYVPPKLESGTPVGNHGALSVKGANLVDKNGKKFQLKGISTHGIQWFPQYVNKDAIKTLRDNWGANVFRIAMYTHENGYCSGGNKAELEKLVSKGVEACTELGMYVIIDWHVLNERDPNVYKADAVNFFDRMSKKYKDNVNVIYEICNEPNGPGWSDVKRYADEVISVIRKNDPDAIIIVGTPTWSQDVDQVAANPVAKPKNVMYALHFYAATHKDDLRNKLKKAYAAGTPVFVSEFSICDASGNGGIDYNSAQAWKELINSYNLSFVSWSLCNKNETSALLSSSTNKTSGWSDNELSAAGRWIRDFISGR